MGLWVLWPLRWARVKHWEKVSLHCELNGRVAGWRMQANARVGQENGQYEEEELTQSGQVGKCSCELYH